jgi:hypothetical protein
LHARTDVHTLRQLFRGRPCAPGSCSCSESCRGREELAQGLYFLLRILDVAEQLLNTLVHNPLCQHLQLEELSDELDETQTLPSGLTA